MQSNGWVTPKIQKKKEALQGVTKHVMSMKIPVVTSRGSKQEKPQKKRKKKRNKRKIDTMFNIRFPLRKGAMLLGRTFFNKNNLLDLTSSPLSDPDLGSSPADEELKRDAASSSVLQTPQLEQNLCEEDAGSGDYDSKTNITVTVFQDTEGSDGVHFNHSDKETEAEEHVVYGRQGGSERLFEDWQSEGVQAQLPAASPDEDWSYKSYYDSDRWYSSASAQTRVEESRQMNENQNTPSCTAQQYHHQDQQTAWGDPGSGTGNTWDHRNLPGEVASFIEAARTNVQTHPAHGGCSSSVRFYETDPRQTGPGLSFNWYHADSWNYTTPPAAVRIHHINQMLNFQNTGPSTHPVWYGAGPVRGHALMQPGAFIQPGQAVYYSSDAYF